MAISLKSVISAFLIALAFIVSLFLHSYQDTQHFPVLILLAAALILAFTGRQITLPSSTPVMTLLLLWSLHLLSFAFSQVPFSSQIALCIFCALPMSFFVLSSFPLSLRERDGVRGHTLDLSGPYPLTQPSPGGRGLSIEKIMLFFAIPIFTILSLWAILQSLFMAGPYGARAIGPVLDPNTLATIFNLGLLSIAGAALLVKTPGPKNCLILLALLIFAGVIATASRSGLIALMLALIPLITVSRIKPNWKKILAVSLGAIAIAIALPAFSGNGLWSQMSRLGRPLISTDASVTDRLSLWHSTWRMMLDHPWIGTGPGTFSLYYPAYRDPIDQSLGHFAHFDALQMGAEMGLVAPILFYTMMVAVLIRTMRALKATSDTHARLRILTPFCALLAVALQAQVNFPLYMMPILIACGVLLALWHEATVAVLKDGTMLFGFTKFWQSLGVWTLGGLTLASILYLSGSAAFGNFYMRQAENAKDPQSTLIALAWAEGMGPDSFIDPEVELARTNLHLLDRTTSIRSPALKATLLKETERLLTSAGDWNPAWAEIDVLRGEMNQIKGQKALMLDSWFAAIRKNPMQFETRQNLASALKENGRMDEAVKVLTDGLNYPHPLAYREWAKAFFKENRKQP